MSAAEAEFAAHGFSHGSLNVIARNAGVAKGSLFQYFEDKADLCAHLSDLSSVRVRTYMEQQIAVLPWADGFFPVLRRLALIWVDYFRTHPMDLALTSATILEPDRSRGNVVRAVASGHYLAVLRPLVRHGLDTGALRPDADIDAFLAFLLVLLPHIALAPHNPALDPLLGLASKDPDEAEAAVDRLLDVLIAAFGTPG